MFESVKQDERVSAMTYFTSLMVSLAVHASILTLLIVLPLTFFRVIQTRDVLAFVLHTPGLPPAYEPPFPPAVPAAPSAPQEQIVEFRSDDLIEPDRRPTTLPSPPPDEIRNPNWGLPGMSTGNTGFSDLGHAAVTPRDIGKILRPLLDQARRIDLPEPPPPLKKPRDVIRVGYLEPSRLLRRVEPVYPPLAIKARVSGKVILEAVIDEEGNVVAVKVLSGHILLNDAAKDAVRQWKFTPTVHNGEPIPIMATIDINFRIVG